VTEPAELGTAIVCPDVCGEVTGPPPKDARSEDEVTRKDVPAAPLPDEPDPGAGEGSGVGADDGAGEGRGVGDGDGLGCGEGLGEGEGLGDGLGSGLGDGLGDGGVCADACSAGVPIAMIVVIATTGPIFWKRPLRRCMKRPPPWKSGCPAMVRPLPGGAATGSGATAPGDGSGSGGCPAG
jgi:hypothetical protein